MKGILARHLSELEENEKKIMWFTFMAYRKGNPDDFLYEVKLSHLKMVLGLSTSESKKILKTLAGKFFEISVGNSFLQFPIYYFY